jgi:hypothetical protein
MQELRILGHPSLGERGAIAIELTSHTPLSMIVKGISSLSLMPLPVKQKKAILIPPLEKKRSTTATEKKLLILAIPGVLPVNAKRQKQAGLTLAEGSTIQRQDVGQHPILFYSSTVPILIPIFATVR